ncbi:MAG TPA: hypothetical protein VGG33_22255 [Polyangia bacterium]
MGVAPSPRGFAVAPLHYLAGLDVARTVLWCYLLWYLVIFVTHFDPSPRLWLTSLGLSFIIGFALLLNAGLGRAGAPRIGRWPAFRFFLMPFGVSSFSALVKGKGFFLVFSPNSAEVLTCLAACATFVALRALARRTLRVAHAG